MAESNITVDEQQVRSYLRILPQRLRLIEATVSTSLHALSGPCSDKRQRSIARVLKLHASRPLGRNRVAQ
jgi:hypothetical protein